MKRIEPSDPVRYCLVCDDENVIAAVKSSCPESHIFEYPLQGLVSQSLELSDSGHAIVECARTADAVLIYWRFDLAPVINTLCFHVRRDQLAPIIALTQGSQEDAIAAIAAGADDAMALPLSHSLLHARMFAYRRLVGATRQAVQTSHTSNNADFNADSDSLQYGPIRLDRLAHRFFVHDEEVELTPREFALLEYLTVHHDELLTRDQILDSVWGINFDTGTNMVDVYMYFLRRKLEARGVKAMIRTVRGRGYRLMLP